MGFLELLVLVVIVVAGVAFWVWRSARTLWYVQRDGQVVGPLETAELAQLYTTGQIAANCPIRQVRDNGWFTAVVTQDPAPRVFQGIRWGLLSLLVGLGIGYGIFGRVMGVYIPMSYIFNADKSAEGAVLVELGARAIPVVGPAILEIGNKMETARICVLVTTVVIGILGAGAGAMLAKGAHRITKGPIRQSPHSQPAPVT
jgi:hypothetical protein